MIHVRKCRPDYFLALADNRKTFELRKEENGEPAFEAGDYLALNEYDESLTGEGYTGAALLFEITYVLRPGDGDIVADLLPSGVAALSLRRVQLFK